MSDLHNCYVCHHQQTHRYACVDCGERMAGMLRDLPELYALTAGEFWPPGLGGSGNSGKASETPLGLRVAALDGRASRVALETLESWERCLREEFTPTQDADLAQRERKAARWADSASSDLHGVTLCGVVDWLTRNLERACMEFVAIDEFYNEVKALHRIARAAAREPIEDVTVIACPADHGEALCGKRLEMRGHEVECSRCGTVWSEARLLMVAQSTEADIWQPISVIAQYVHYPDGTPIPERTLRHWAQHGHVRRRGNMLQWSSVLAHANRNADVDTA
jgi:hypothetical protein